MFYSQLILAKKGPLGTIWIAAHLERKLHKNQVADTDIGVSVDSILFPDVPIALRLSSHLLLGVVRIYNRKVNYLFDDCSEALLKVKQAFRSTAVDLPPEESKAPYNSITLPEKFDLDDFELPDSDIFQGNYVDHHISSREQITLQDSMEGVSYSTSKFGLDERFGDGDASGLDLDEELFLNKVCTEGVADQSVDPEAFQSSMTLDKREEHHEDRAIDSQVMADGADEPADVMDFAQAPRTPGLVEEPTLSNAKDVLACDDHLESEYHLIESNVRENDKYNSLSCEDKQEISWRSRDDTNSDEDNVHIPSGLEIKESGPLGESRNGQNEAITLELSDRIEACDVLLQQDSPTETVKEDKIIDETGEHHQGPNEAGFEKSDTETSGLVSTTQQVSEGLSLKDLESPAVEVPNSVEDISNQQKTCDDAPELVVNQVGLLPGTPETEARQETTILWNLKAHDKEGASILVENPNVTKPGDNSISTEVDGKSNTAASETYGGEETMESGKEYGIIINSEQTLNENQMQEHGSGEDSQSAISGVDVQVHNTNSRPEAQANNTNSQDTMVENLNNSTIFHNTNSRVEVQVINTNSKDNLVENLNNSTEPELPAPEKLLSVPEVHMDSHRDMLVEISPSMAGKKRSFTESTLTEQSLNSVESSRHVRVKRTAVSVPDDDDLLSSILGGRKSSILKLKPTPPLTEVTSTKRTRFVRNSGVPKRKLIMDDTMVLHGDMIRHQLTNTEDIRRVRKKAPCTFSEISMIRTQHMEDQIFLGTILTGVSVQLASLFSQAYDLSRISVCKNDANRAPFETMTETRSPLQNDKNDASLETVFEPNLASLDERYDTSLETVASAHFTSLKNENHDNGPGNNNVIEIIEQNSDLLIEADKEIKVPSENRLEEVNSASTDVNFSREQEQTKPSNDMGADDSQPELFVNPCIISDVDVLDPTGRASGDMGMVRTDSLNEFVERNSHTNMDASDVITSIFSVELDYVDVDGGQVIARNEVTEGVEIEFEAKDDIFPGGARDEAVEMVPDVNDGESERNLETENYNIISGKQQVDFAHETVEIVSEDGLVNNDENPNNPEAYQPNTMGADISGFGLRVGDANVRVEIEFGEMDDIFTGGARDAAVEMVPDINHGELEHNLETENYNFKSEKQQEVDFFTHEAAVSVAEDDFLNNVENPNNSEAYQPNTTEADISGFGLRDEDDINYPAAGNDTEFLNVDDDELTEIADDHMADDEETRYTENSGWSSRTRAVSKYLQTAFTKEAECGNKSLSADNLLAGKSRKEASRMFFETLVLKTRDYIHVEQPNPYDDIIIKPRTMLMKSDF